MKMNTKAAGITAAIFIAAISLVCLLFWVIPGIRPDTYSAVLIAKTNEEDFEFWQFVRQGAEEGAREFGVSLEMTGPPSEADAAAQADLVYEAIEQAPDMIILAACDAQVLAEPAQAVRDAGIVLILMDCYVESDGPGFGADCFVGIDNVEAGRFLAAELAENLPDGGEVAVLTNVPGATTAIDRVEGIERGLAVRPDVSLVEIADCGGTAQGAEEKVRELLEAYPDLRGIIGTNPVCTEGAARVLKERSADEDHIFLYAFDTSASQNAYLEDGVVDGVVAQIAFNLGYLSIDAGRLACRGQLRTSRMDSGYVYATKSNMREENIQKLIYPFV